MIAKVQPTRQHASSFRRLCKYLTEERDANTGEPLLRGDVVLSDNLAGLDTVAVQMEGIAFLNPRCKDALCHYELSWPDKKVLLSQAAAHSVIEVRAQKQSIQKRRQETFPKNLRTWVADKASEGDAWAAAQLRGWRYADQRNQRRVDARLESDALHIGPPPDPDGSTDWADLAQQRLAAQQKQQALANQIAATRIWQIDRKTGDVSYTLNGQVSVIDRGRVVTVLNQDKAAVLFGLEMAIQKYGSRIACTGTVEWKRMVSKVAAQHGISVQFTDPEMQHALRVLQRLANPRQRQQERGGR